MTKLERIEQEVQSLSPGELADFRQWFTAYDAAKWDERLERDVNDGKLNYLCDEAIADHEARRTREL